MPTNSLPTLKLKPHLALHSRPDNRYLLEDADDNKFFRLGTVEGRLVAGLLSGESFEAVATAVYQETGKAIAPEVVSGLCEMLMTHRLMEGAQPTRRLRRANVLSLLTLPFYWKIPLLNPDKALVRIQPWVGWLHGAWCFWTVLAAFLGMALITLPERDAFVDSVVTVFSASRWIWLAVAWFVLKVVHEFAHASTCRHYGGKVKEAGIAAILFVPLAYVNVNSSWRFASRWQRLHVTMAGVWAEFGVAALALLVWHFYDQMLIRTMMADVVLMATTSSLLFNLNPLVKFDGYFALMDITGVDNLRDLAKQQTDYLFWRYFLGIATPKPDDSTSTLHWIAWYGLLSWFYRISVSAGLIAGAAVLFGGAGMTIAIAGAFAFFVQPVWMVLARLVSLVVQRQVNALVLILRCGLLVGLSFALTWLIPLHWTWTEPGVVEYDPPMILRATVSGVVDQVLVDSGQFVSKDDHVLTLSNPELELRRFELEKQFGLLQLEVAGSRWQQDASELQNAETKLAAMAEQIQIVRSQVDQLTVRASVAGRVVARNFQQWAGRYVDEGQELAAIGDERSKRIKLAVSQIRAEHASQWLGKPVAVFANGQHVCDALAQRMETSASNVASELRLLAVNGGRLATVTNEQDQSTLIESRVNAFVQLSPDQAARLRCGQRVYVALGGTSESVGSWIWKKTQHAVSAVQVAWSTIR